LQYSVKYKHLQNTNNLLFTEMVIKQSIRQLIGCKAVLFLQVGEGGQRLGF